MGVGFQAVQLDGLAGLRVIVVNVPADVRATLRATGVRPLEVDPRQAAAQAPLALRADALLADALTTELIRIASATTPVVAIANTATGGLAALEAGAAGVVSVDDGIDDVLRALRTVARGGVYINNAFLGSVVDELRALRAAQAVECPANPLSSREAEIAAEVAQGQNNAEIARSLHLSPKTVKNHVSNCLGKLGLANRTQLAVYAVSAGLCEAPHAAEVQPRTGDWSDGRASDVRPTQPVG